MDMLNYVVNIYEGGKVVSLIVDSNPNGSHVGSIAAAFFPTKDSFVGTDEEGNMSGVALGARLISFKIVDARLDTMETGSALSRALIEAVKFK